MTAQRIRAFLLASATAAFCQPPRSRNRCAHCEMGSSLCLPVNTAALALAEKVARQSPSSTSVCKRLIQAARLQPMAHALPTEREWFVDLFDTQDQKEGVNAFLEKRAPVWKNA